MFPVNHWVHREAIVFQTAWSSALRFKQGAPVVFEVDAADPETRSGWSVLVEGTLEQITDAVDLAALGRLEHRTWAPSADEVWMRVAPTHVSGRRVERHLRSGDGGPLPYMHPG
jgi:hypothetical protein